MDPMDIMREYMLAKEEHERALAAVGAVRQQLEAARAEYADARQAELQMEQDLQSATAKVAAGLEEMHLSASGENNDASATSASADAEATSADAVDSAVERARAPVMPVIGDFLVEYHRNIGCYHCYLFVEDGSRYDQVDAKQLTIQVDFPEVKLLINKQGANTEGLASADKSADTTEEHLWWSTEIERNVDQAKCVIDVKTDHIYLRLPVKEGDKDVAGDGFSSFSQITSKELDKSHYSNIMCRACDNVLVQATAESPIERVLPLPSANWMDMFDFWGAGLGAFEHLPREDIFAQKARVYVGEAHILLHEDNTMPEALASVPVSTTASTSANQKQRGDSEEEDSKSFWQPLQCTKCAAAIGMRHTENAQTIRLDKHLIASKSPSAATNGSQPAASETTELDIFARYTVDSVVCTKLLEFADSDGVFRFTLRSSSEKVALQMQLLSWETLIKVKSSPSEFRRVLKVLYVSSPQAQTTASPLPVAPAQDLVFAPAICDSVASRLQLSSTLLPASLRRFNKMDVGYLYA